MPITEPFRIHIAADWFFMGSDAGQTGESPVHRVWLDSFAMAATQVTVEEYAPVSGRHQERAAPILGRSQLLSSSAACGGGFVV